LVAVQPRRLSWRLADVVEVVSETSRTKSLVLAVPGWEGHKAGQHVDVRLTAEDGSHLPTTPSSRRRRLFSLSLPELASRYQL
jgi:ferredoxin-NADP reductase